MNQRSVSHAILLLILVFGSACHRSGTWVNDSKNWERAFGYKKPADVKVVESVYWRTPHFTYEAGFHFHVRSNAALQKLWTTAPQLKPSFDASTNQNLKFGDDRPHWFAPKPISDYDVWVATNEHSGLRLLIDKQTGDLFVTDAQ